MIKEEQRKGMEAEYWKLTIIYTSSDLRKMEEIKGKIRDCTKVSR